jgi:cell wall-associated NlpC family hydrolase
MATGCSLMPSHTPPSTNPKVISTEKSHLSNAEVTKKQLYLQYQQWKGTPYANGGLSKKGIDCSGFAYITYRDKFGLNISRTTRSQSKRGKEVPRQELRPGDLIFFKTGITQRHVGIYLEGNKFVHVSTKKGVMISRLNDYYWRNKYWFAKRVNK